MDRKLVLYLSMLLFGVAALDIGGRICDLWNWMSVANNHEKLLSIVRFLRRLVLTAGYLELSVT